MYIGPLFRKCGKREGWWWVCDIQGYCGDTYWQKHFKEGKTLARWSE